jgi:hypothetical protein
MSTPLTSTQFRTLVHNAGIPATFYDGWSTRNRGQRGDGWGKTEANPTGVHGVLLHHTVTRDVARTISLVRDIGQPENDVPPPLYAGVIDKSGHLHMVGWGRCNHAGLGDPDVLAAVVAERMPLPPPNELTVDGNARFYGFAGVNMGDGEDPWPAAQLHTMGELSGIICKWHGWTERSVIGHLEWQRGKIDPHSSQGSLMPALRHLVREVVQ